MNALSLLLARFTFLRWMALGLMLGVASPALAAKTYSDNLDGTVTDPTTGLQWMRCSMGQTWTGSTCSGTASAYTWAQAVALTNTVTFAGHSDWRLPNIRELQTIVDRSMVNPAIDNVAFPNTPAFYFWSASAYASNAVYAWFVVFSDGGADFNGKSDYYRVRLVRDGQSFGLLDIARPSTDYVDQGNGTVAHTPTRLMWQRCALGQTWTGSTCSGTASAYTWAQAVALTNTVTFAGHSDWRLPTEEELLSLVDYTKWNPAINVSLFPNTPASDFWSTSASVYSSYSSGDAWVVYFGIGSGYRNGKFYTFQVRLVRAGQSFGPLTLTLSKTGTGEVVSNAWPFFKCGALLCSGGYNSGDAITLAVTPASNLIAWGGACSGSAPTCIVTMDAAKSVTVTFKDTPLITGLPTSLNFPLQNIASTSVAQHVTLANTGTAALNITSMVASGDFSVLDNCGAGIGSGGSCTIDVSFTPSAIGVRSGTLTLTTDAPDSPHTISLSGTGQGAVVALSTNSLTFASQNQGSRSAAQIITLSNPGGAVLHLNVVVNGEFGVSSTTCGLTLAKAASCSISVTFAPISVGVLSGSLVITSDAVSSPDTVTLNGTGVAAPVVLLNPTSLSFAAQTVGSSSAVQKVRLTNTGAAALTQSVAAGGDFSQTNNCGTGLGAAGFCDISVTFTPTAIGTRVGAITITSNAVGSPYSMVVNGTGRSPNAPVCTLSAAPSRVRKNDTSILTPTCNPAATTYAWTGGTCQGTTAPTCTVTPAATTTYGVTGTNSYGFSTASTDVVVKAVDLTPILMLLLD